MPDLPGFGHSRITLTTLFILFHQTTETCLPPTSASKGEKRIKQKKKTKTQKGNQKQPSKSLSPYDSWNKEDKQNKNHNQNLMDGQGTASCFKRLTDPKKRHAVQWLLNTFYVAESGSVSKAEVYAAYLVYCSRKNEEPFSRAVFGRLVVCKGTNNFSATN